MKPNTKKKPGARIKGTARRPLDDLYDFVTGVCDHEPSEVILEMWKVVECAVLHPRKQRDAFIALSQRFNGDQCEPWTYEGNAMVQVMNCEWLITNADLECWADFCRYGGRYFPNGGWGNLTGSLRSLLHDARRYQSLVRYREFGGRVRRDHRKLLSKCCWEMELGRGDGVSLYVEGKRPLGDSARELAMVEALGWKRGKEEDIPPEMKERLWELWDELPYALAAILRNDRADPRRPAL